MEIRLYVTNDSDQQTARQTVDQVSSEGVSLDVVRVHDAGMGDQRLPMSVLQVMALKGADAFPLAVVDGNPAKSGDLPNPADLKGWIASGVSEPVALVTDAVNAVEFAGASRVHISLDVTSVEAALPFYMLLFDARPTKRRDDYVKFELEEPRLNITLNEHEEGHASSGHYGIQVKSSGMVRETEKRLREAGFAITEETETACCYAVQTKIWVVDPDGNRWEVFVVTEAEADEGCGADCVCYQDLERSFIAGAATTAVDPSAR
ncbi:ArsI/CadI family heavy metal resistance metalloenzyme [Saccharothrix obliqua]|uniref:ArsI/CadI family heavy metal resistance metalloenzyme n=1 Tax=Saccharothrix obliqua TaxID=2861747 RepID=UPI001C5FCA86|nr:ArsI/CadI family heavy metal resistance metalloenzyme [Saccharothrix obliqua]MBW4718726.1 VOC family protein [Saccharothrix obliqua]